MTTLDKRTTWKTIHYFSGVTLAIFIGFHLLNHLLSLGGPALHIVWMERFRLVYRHPVIETMLLAAVVFQFITGIRLLTRHEAKIPAEKIQVYSGLYLSFFLVVHMGGVMTGRLVEHLDTNFYYAGVGMNYYPATFFFLPYYFLSVASISLHIASLHYLKTRSTGISYAIAGVGILAAVLITIGFTHGFQWRDMPAEYPAFIYKYFGRG
ncbi:hypothetical protein KK062_25610 [Fulvivirgaceae bacterium PWU5]|uniref:Uncharacterized protein n=1 Tax=Dawidia cretensis TaxID=2782350 RepID=A0AAP2E287_9BACT|nr:hypothetical protein [Dawidia cretensis]MBT1711646.1 hypothetical protein [Dawidia cretensis]